METAGNRRHNPQQEFSSKAGIIPQSQFQSISWGNLPRLLRSCKCNLQVLAPGPTSHPGTLPSLRCPSRRHIPTLAEHAPLQRHKLGTSQNKQIIGSSYHILGQARSQRCPESNQSNWKISGANVFWREERLRPECQTSRKRIPTSVAGRCDVREEWEMMYE